MGDAIVRLRLIIDRLKPPFSVDAFNTVVAGEDSFAAMLLREDGPGCKSIVAQQLADQVANDIAEAINTIPVLLVEIDRLRAEASDTKALVDALEPFARAASEWDGEPASLNVEFCAYDEPRMNPSALVADFRNAAAALAQHRRGS